MTRQKRNARYRVLERRPVGPQPGVTSDQVIRLTGKAAGCLSTPLRRIGYRDPETRQLYVFLTNLFHLTAGEVAAIYKARCELFFKWVKQHLKLKSSLGTTANAVMTQVWVALCVYLLVAYVKFLLRLPGPSGPGGQRTRSGGSAPVRDFQAVTGHGAGVSGSGAGVGLGGAKRAETGTKVETAELVRKTAKTFVCRGIGVG